MEIEKAKETLLKSGYQVYNLWSIHDVQDNYDCTDQEAMEVLIQALTNDATMEQIWFAVNFHAEENGLKEKENDQ
tara:strand:- start:684 stop:908 length:225 start_codon:yes stop_codon:yes gene_type:complete